MVKWAWIFSILLVLPAVASGQEEDDEETTIEENDSVSDDDADEEPEAKKTPPPGKRSGGGGLVKDATGAFSIVIPEGWVAIPVNAKDVVLEVDLEAWKVTRKFETGPGWEASTSSRSQRLDRLRR